MGKRKPDYLIFVFWLTIVFFIDPGGFLDVHFGSQFQRLLTSYGFVAIMYYCYFAKKREVGTPYVHEKAVRSYIKIIIVWYGYYIIWFFMLNNDYYPGLLQVFTHNGRMLSQGLLVIPLIYFTFISIDYFIKITTWVTIIVLSLLFFSISTQLPIVEFIKGGRGFIEADRYFMYGDGILFFSATLGLASMISQSLKKTSIIVATIIVLVYIYLTFTRRLMVGVVEYVLIISLLTGFIYRKNALSRFGVLLSPKYIVFYSIAFLLLNVYRPDALTKTNMLLTESYNIVAKSETTTGQGDDRMSLTQNQAISRAVKGNFWLGTGFDSNWQRGDGGVKGWEGSDYIFLSALAMYGLIGLLVFLPFYILVISIIRKGTLLLRKNFHLLGVGRNELAPYLLVFIASSSEFIKNMIEYPNWFYPIGMLGGTQQYFIYFGLLAGSFLALKQKVYKLKNYHYAN